MKGVVVKSQIPGVVAEGAIKLDQGGGPTLVAPCELPVLEVDFLKIAVLERTAELAHEAQVEVPIVLVAGAVNEIEIAEDEPFLLRGRCKSPDLTEESRFRAVGARAID